eukprot:COSAG01_NODE_23_length_37704_cov_30.005877_15_plen_49_part_00
MHGALMSMRCAQVLPHMAPAQRACWEARPSRVRRTAVYDVLMMRRARH